MKEMLIIALLFSAFLNANSQIGLDINGMPASNGQFLVQHDMGADNNEASFKTQAVVINTIPCPTNLVGDIAYDGENIWVGGVNELFLFKISPLDGSVLKTIPTTISYPYGVTFGNDHLWVASNTGYEIHELDTFDGSVIQTFY